MDPVDEDLLYHKYEIHMSDGSVWQIPVSTIALHHAKHQLFGKLPVNVQLFTITIPLFREEDEIHKHARKMSWDDVKHFAKQVRPADDVDYATDWEKDQHEYEIF